MNQQNTITGNKADSFLIIETSEAVSIISFV